MTGLKILPFLFAVALPLFAQNGKEVSWNNPSKPIPDYLEHETLKSNAMDREIGYTIYAPPGYETSKLRYPTIYFLHGYGGDETSDGAAFAQIVDTLIRKGEIPPVLCIFPNGGKSGYRDHPDTGINVETMIIKELIPHVDSTYRTIPERNSRLIAGYSMGGAGAIRLSIKYSELFSATASWAGAVNFPRRSNSISPDLRADKLQALENKPRLLLIVGTADDVTYADHPLFLRELHKAAYPFTYVTLDGVKHNLGTYYELSGIPLVKHLVKELPHQSEEQLKN